MKRLAITLLVTVSLGSCIPIARPPYPQTALAVWWKLVEACSGKVAAFHEWTFATDSYDTVMNLGDVGEVWGVTYPDKRLIVLSSRGAMCPKIVRHEMFHAIEPRYDATHPDSIFEHCRGLVTPATTDARDC